MQVYAGCQLTAAGSKQTVAEVSPAVVPAIAAAAAIHTHISSRSMILMAICVPILWSILYVTTAEHAWCTSLVCLLALLLLLLL